MGNQTSSSAICGGCAPAGLAASTKALDIPQAVMPSAEELEVYLKDVKTLVTESVETPEARYRRYIDAMNPDPERMRHCAETFKHELEIGLDCHKRHPHTYVPEECSFKMIDSYVPHSPSGKESGVFYALDFGGSNFRVVRCELEHGRIRTTAKKASLMDAETPHPKGLLDPAASATEMFDFFATIVEQFMRESGDLDHDQHDPLPLGFTFSYPVNQKAVDAGTLMVWTKGFETGRGTDDPVEGTDAVELMNMAFQRKHLPLRTNCIANDTVGTLLSCAYSQSPELPPCYVGLILGTGMNACYIEPNSQRWAYKSNILNIECGNFNRDSLPRTAVDHEVDFEDVGGRGRQHLEKMVSGAYLGEVCRRTLVKVFQVDAPALMWQQDTLLTEDAAGMIQDKSEQLVVVARKVKERWNVEMSAKHLQWVKGVCEVVFRRAAALSAMLVSGCAMQTGRLQEAMGGLSVGIDGSLYKCNPFFREDMRHWMNEILGARQASLVHLAFADDGSGLGASVLSAVVESSKHDSSSHHH